MKMITRGLLKKSFAQSYADGYEDGRAEGFTLGWGEGFGKGLKEEREAWRQWNRDRLKAEARGRPFNQPPPGEAGQDTSREGKAKGAGTGPPHGTPPDAQIPGRSRN